jgi:hypothetical protein
MKRLLTFACLALSLSGARLGLAQTDASLRVERDALVNNSLDSVRKSFLAKAREYTSDERKVFSAITELLEGGRCWLKSTHWVPSKDISRDDFDKFNSLRDCFLVKLKGAADTISDFHTQHLDLKDDTNDAAVRADELRIRVRSFSSSYKSYIEFPDQDAVAVELGFEDGVPWLVDMNRRQFVLTKIAERYYAQLGQLASEVFGFASDVGQLYAVDGQVLVQLNAMADFFKKVAFNEGPDAINFFNRDFDGKVERARFISAQRIELYTRQIVTLKGKLKARRSDAREIAQEDIGHDGDEAQDNSRPWHR